LSLFFGWSSMDCVFWIIVIVFMIADFVLISRR
jgi:hypothetical protein